MLRTLPHGQILPSKPAFELNPCKTGLHPWNRLPQEVAILVLAAWEGEDCQMTVSTAAQVHPVWDDMLQWAQPKRYKDLQQRTMLRQVTAGAGEPISPLTKQRLRRYDELAFDVVAMEEGQEKALREVTQEQLAVVMGLMAPATSCHLQGLRKGAELAVLWASKSEILRPVRRMSFGRGRQLRADLQKLLGAADKMPDITHVELKGTALPRRCESPVLATEHTEEQTLQFDVWPKLQVLDLCDGSLNVSGIALRSNPVLQNVDLGGNSNAAEFLLSENSPGPSLRRLRLPAEGMRPSQCAMLQDAPWAPALSMLLFVSEAEGVKSSKTQLKNLWLGNMVSLQHLELANVAVHYDSMRLGGCGPQTLDLADSGMSWDNQPHPDFFALELLNFLRLSRNQLAGLLNELRLFAAPSLNRLDLSRCGLNDVDFVFWQVPIHNCLEHLDVSDNNLDGAGLHALAQKPLKSLQYLGIRVHKKREAQRLVQVVLRLSPLRQFWPKLQTLSIFIHQVRNPKHQERLQITLQEENIALQCY